MKQIEKNPAVVIAGDWFTAHGKGVNPGWFGKSANQGIAEKLSQAFSAWIGITGHISWVIFLNFCSCILSSMCYNKSRHETAAEKCIHILTMLQLPVTFNGIWIYGDIAQLGERYVRNV